MPRVTWTSKLGPVLGARTAKKLTEALGVETVGDLLTHYPRAWVGRGQTSDLSTLEHGEHMTVVARVVSSSVNPYRDRRSGGTAYRVEVIAEVGGQRLALTFFDKRQHVAMWRARHLSAGTIAMFEGRADLDRFRSRWQLVHPIADILEAGDAAIAEELAGELLGSRPSLRPIYPASKKAPSWVVERSVAQVLAVLDDVPELVPDDVRRRLDLADARAALSWMHMPESEAQRAAGERALRFAEAFLTQVALSQRRSRLAALPARPRVGVVEGLLDRFDRRLPFALTEGQRTVSEEILADLAAGHPMHRLLQGEVGSGKTVVALRAMLRVVDSGGQAALLAPTEVLAQQHARSIATMLGDLAQGGMLTGAEDGTRLVLLTGSLPAAARKEALADIASGAAGLVVGTHALLESTVAFADLGVVVVDEQHRFGVEQRAALSTRATTAPPHVLVMTATPIPRTVAMTVFGDLDVSTLVELPSGRAPIQSSVVPVAERPAWLHRAWQRVREEVSKGHQVYVVCAQISPRETDAAASGPDPAAVEVMTPELSQGALAGLRVSPLHGQMSPDDKDSTMQAFARGELDVLVATTVIEVGVDVPNATVMVVLDADRFGVSQLHQLRGRVGRGGLPGLCLLVTSAEADTPARSRVEAVAATTDGFELARVDLKQRREGDVLGAAQSGRRSTLKLLSVLRDEAVIVQAREVAAEVVAHDPELSTHRALATAVLALDETEQADYLEKA